MRHGADLFLAAAIVEEILGGGDGFLGDADVFLGGGEVPVGVFELDDAGDDLEAEDVGGGLDVVAGNEHVKRSLGILPAPARGGWLEADGETGSDVGIVRVFFWVVLWRSPLMETE